MRNNLGRGVGLCVWVGLLSAGCTLKKPEEKHFYDQHIQPIFNQFCASNTSPCHAIEPTTGTAFGNLDLSSYEGVQKRRDVLRKYGSYPLPLLLLKAIPEKSVQISYLNRTPLMTSEIRHAGGKTLETSSEAYGVLVKWLQNGANRDGIAPAATSNGGQGACNTALPPDRDLSGVDAGSDAYQKFTADVMPKLKASCAFATCHSSPQSDFYITCGDDDAQMKFNFLQAADFVAPSGTAPEQSEVLLRPLAPAGGGVSHTGGIFFPSRADDTWLKWKAWAVAVQSDPPARADKSTGQQFFEANVMPIFLKRGCALEGCHSPDGFNDFRLRPGAQGFFAPSALKRNYETALREFMALDSVDVRQSRIVKKNIFAQSGGIAHRAGALLESEQADSAADCPAWDGVDADKNSVLCTFNEWHRLERADRAGAVSPMATGDVLPLAYVVRPPDPDSLLEFDTFRGGADLMVADVTLGARGAIGASSVTNARSVLGKCAGLQAGTADVRGPEWSYDGTKLVFAGRPSAASGLDLYMIDVAGGGACAQLTTDGGRMQGPVKVHNFDPVFAPNGAIVFASTRTGTLTQKTFLPNADLWRSGPDANFANLEQMTFLLNTELGPAFMQDGRMSFTAEKASPEFYQVSGRRMNWDLTDYHPLLAQRAQSTDTFTDMLYQSVGYSQATEIREGLDRNFLVILSDIGAQGGGGALATFNRSVGPFQEGRTDKTGKNLDASFLKSVQLIDPAATGRDGTQGVYRSPFSLPDGQILASYDGSVTNPAGTTPRYALVAYNPTTSARTTLVSDPARSIVEAVVGYKRAETLLFHNLPQLVFGGHSGVQGGYGIMHFPDLPMVATLLGANLRQGRNVDLMDKAVGLKVYEDLPPPASDAPVTGSQGVYSNRQPIGTARFEADHSLKVYVPTGKPLILELVDASGNAVLTMKEEHQLAVGEYVTPGVPRKLFNGVCGGCHGSISGSELDIAVTPDALTGASASLSRDKDPKPLQ